MATDVSTTWAEDIFRVKLTLKMASAQVVETSVADNSLLRTSVTQMIFCNQGTNDTLTIIMTEDTDNKDLLTSCQFSIRLKKV